METLFPIFLAVVLAGTLLTEGAVIGAGINAFATDYRRVGTAIGPLFLGTEVWFVALIGLVAGGFPDLEASILTTAYPLLALFLFSWIARDAALWFGPRIVSAAWQGFWGTVLAVASLVIAIALGGVIGIALSGGAAGGHHAEFELARLAAPPVWIGAVVLPVVLAWHGRSFLRWRGGAQSEGPVDLRRDPSAERATLARVGGVGAARAGWQGWVSSAVVVVIGAGSVALGAGTIAASVTSPASAAVLAALAIPVFAFMLIVQGMWWWIAGRQRAVTEFFAWRREERRVPSAPAPGAAPVVE